MNNLPVQTSLFDPLVEYINGYSFQPGKGTCRISFIFPGNIQIDMKKVGEVMKKIEYIAVDECNQGSGSYSQISGELPYDIGMYLINKLHSPSSRIYPIFSDELASVKSKEEVLEYLKRLTNG